MRIFLTLLFISVFLSVSVVRVNAQDEPPGEEETEETVDVPEEETGTETEDGAPGGVVGVVSTVIQNITHKLFFPSDVFAEALTYIFKVAASNEEKGIQGMIGVWSSSFYQMMKPPDGGYFKSLAQKSIPIAAGLAVPFFILRLAIYHWNSLLGNKDDLLAAVGDWLTTGLMVIAVGPGLDLVVQIAWWMVDVMTGSPASLAQNYVSFFATTSLVRSLLPGASFLRAIVVTAILITGVLAIASIGLAFLSGSVALFLLAYIGAPIMVLGVVPQARWLRFMWLQAVALVCVLPLAAGVIFTVGLEVAGSLPSDNLISILFRVLFLFGASGFLFSLSGILGKVTLGAAGDALKGLISAGKAVISSALIAGTVVATGGTTAPLAGAGMTAAGSTTTAGMAGAGGLAAAANSLDTAQAWTTAGNIASGLGLDRAATFFRGNAALAQLQSRQADLNARVASFGPGAPQMPGGSTSGYGQKADAAIGRVFNGPNANALFSQGFNGLKNNAGPDGREWLGNMMRSGTDDMMVDVAKMAHAYNDFSTQIDNSDRPLWEAANLGGTSQDTLDFLGLMYGGNP
jgi:hypothetical protein